MTLTENQKQINADYWKKMISLTKEGGTINWIDEKITYTVIDRRMNASSKKDYKKLMANTNVEFMTNHANY